jgi:DMSO/TMAO reductase YedYZ molybdopterin-dependent catalytic subunit
VKELLLTVGIGWVRLGLLLEKAGLPQQARTVEFHATDGYTVRLTLSTAMREDVIVAYEKDGSSLPETTRLVIPSANGSEWISRITQIRIL